MQTDQLKKTQNNTVRIAYWLILIGFAVWLIWPIFTGDQDLFSENLDSMKDYLIGGVLAKQILQF